MVSKVNAFATIVFFVALSTQANSQQIVPFGAYDVDSDLSVSAIDANVVITFLGGGPTPRVHPGSTRFTYDVTSALPDFFRER